MYRSIGAKAITKPMLGWDLQCVVQEIVYLGELAQGSDYGT